MNYKLLFPLLFFSFSPFVSALPEENVIIEPITTQKKQTTRYVKKYRAKISAVQPKESPVIQQIWPQLQQQQQVQQVQQAQAEQQIQPQQYELIISNFEKQLGLANQKIAELEMKLAVTEQERSKTEKELLYYKGFYEGFYKAKEGEKLQKLAFIPIGISAAGLTAVIALAYYLKKLKKT